MRKNKVDQSYIFTDKQEAKNNGGKHGRMIFCSKNFLNAMCISRCLCKKCTQGGLYRGFGNLYYYRELSIGRRGRFKAKNI
jgi:hypothetical protein